ncbi:MAG: hypothetical protein JNN26_20030 [Candidatus Obscuribacter sp.]|nr:hypothetical protein [Candidatus Obscuribacter sp.]MBL8084922.1 hypothetical protein [Candidatus Obscuribacter sp.]
MTNAKGEPVSLPASPLLSFDDMRFVLALCLEAGKIAIAMRAGVDISTKFNAEDLVTTADKALSELIMKRLAERFPEDLVLSEEAPWLAANDGRRRWIIDPIDGTKFYVDGSGKYAIMVGLIVDGREAFGALAIPARDVAFMGGPGLGAFVYREEALTPLAGAVSALDSDYQLGARPLRLMVSKNDLNANPWLKELPGVELVTASSIGFDVYELHLRLADLFVHIRPTLGYWDTAASGAVAQSMGFEVGSEKADFLSYGYESPTHLPHVVIGKPGALKVWRRLFEEHCRCAAAAD